MGRLVAAGRWLDRHDVAAGYDAAAPTYDLAWREYLAPVTDALLARLPEPPPGDLLDLGCGTGHATAALARRWPGRRLEAVDVSPGMLASARARLAGSGAELTQGDLLEFLQGRPARSAGLVFSAWAIGYSRPEEVIRQSARALAPGGILAFVVNRMQALGPVFRAFRAVMTRRPDAVRRALWPRWPRDWAGLERALFRSGLGPEWHEEGDAMPQPPGGRPSLEWLLQTGVLAGFDAVLPLRTDAVVAAEFEAALAEALAADPGPLLHRYVAAIARKKT
jgi:trans-aconitate 2-methyltransferase